MQRLSTFLLAIALVLAIAVGLVWGQKRAALHNNTQLVRTYQVPPERAEEVKSALGRLLWIKEGSSWGSAQIFGSGLMIVRAPEGFQEGIDQLVRELPNTTKSPVQVNVRFDYWLVMGESGSRSNSASMGVLDTVLASIDKVDGPRKFQVLEHISSTNQSGSQAKIKGSLSELTEYTRISDGRLSMDLAIETATGDVHATTAAESGEFLVLGQNAIRLDNKLLKRVKPSTSWAKSPPDIYHIVRIELLK